jgi:demethylmenaquinone methyltransferase/2-methoxy-6-polyprenyl-1,4-benzoquinol methylase
MAKYVHETIVPYKGSELSKKQQIANMFDRIAFRYDFLNHFLSAGIDVTWRKKAIEQLKTLQPQFVLDVATGTGDIAILTHNILHPSKITGIDISDGMLEIGRKKIEKLGLEEEIELVNGDSESMSFPTSSFDAITVAFGVRNFENLEKGLREMLRVLKPNGQLVVLEFSRPKQILFKGMYNFYMQTIAPGVGKMIAKNKDAYQYLNDSVQKFPEGKEFITILNNAGFKNTYYKTLTMGICSIYVGSK